MESLEVCCECGFKTRDPRYTYNASPLLGKEIRKKTGPYCRNCHEMVECRNLRESFAFANDSKARKDKSAGNVSRYGEEDLLNSTQAT